MKFLCLHFFKKQSERVAEFLLCLVQRILKYKKAGNKHRDGCRKQPHTSRHTSLQGNNSAMSNREGEEEQNNSALSSDAVYGCAHNMWAFISVAFLSRLADGSGLIKLCSLCCRRAIHEASRGHITTSQKR